MRAAGQRLEPYKDSKLVEGQLRAPTMGFVLSLLYLVVSYLTPEAVFGPLAQYRIELILAVLALLVSLPRLIGSFVFRTPQSLALIGLAIAVLLSVLVGVHWAGGAVGSFLKFIPCAYAYFLVCLHCNSKRKLQIIVLMLLFVCLFVIVRGSIDLHRVAMDGAPPASDDSGDVDLDQWNTNHAFLLPMKDDAGNWFYRIRGLGEINDPNDFGQLLVCVIPLLFFFWTPEKTFRNFVFVVLPACLLVVGIYLTHSRGALLALVALALLAARRRIGTVPAAIGAAALFAAAMALQFTGGRAISADAGADRTALWGGGMEALKSHFLFGVGFGQLPDYLGLTAHNSIVVCAAELGLFGLYFWSLFLLPTFRNALIVASPSKIGPGHVAPDDEFQAPFAAWKGQPLDKANVNRMGPCLLLSVTGFLVAAWFLSRALVMTFFLLGGLVQVVYQEARRESMVDSDLPFPRTLAYSLLLAIGLLVVVYIVVRVLNFVH